MKRIFVLLLFVATLLCLPSCEKKKSDEELIRERIEVFCTTYNDGDFEGVVNCLDNKTRNTIKKTAEFADGLISIFGDKTVDSFQLFSALWGVSIGVISEDDYMTVEILAVDVTSEKKAVVTTEMAFSDTTTAEIAYFKMVREEDGWYIGDITEEK